MKKLVLVVLALSVMLAIGCSKNRANAPAMKDKVEDGLKQAGYSDINVDENRDKGVITLKGNVKSTEDKDKAEEVAKANADGEIIANELLVAGSDESHAKNVQGATDDAIEARWKEFVKANRLENQHIRADAKNGVLTLKGDVDTAEQRMDVEKNAAKIEGVTQVVNELTVKGNKSNRKAAAR
jgi:hyperosmotically inducible periplasmic protein